MHHPREDSTYHTFVKPGVEYWLEQERNMKERNMKEREQLGDVVTHLVML